MIKGYCSLKRKKIMKKQLRILGIIVILLTVGLCGCNEDTSQLDEEKIIGTWTKRDMYNGSIRINSYIFYTNKTFNVISSYKDEFLNVNGKWNITDNKLIMISEDKTVTADYKFSKLNEDKKLTITDKSGNSVLFI